MKVYVVTECGGQYEDKWFKIHSVWDSAQLAQEQKEKLQALYEEIRHSSPPYPEDEFDYYLLSEEQMIKQDNWQQEQYHIEDIGIPFIQEFELNQPVL